MTNVRIGLVCAISCFAMWPVVARAQAPAPEAASSRRSDTQTYDRLWQAFSQWYQSDTDRIVQSVTFSGRYQHDFAAVNAEQGDHHEWNARRMRLGPRVRMFRRLVLHAEAEFNPQEA